MFPRLIQERPVTPLNWSVGDVVTLDDRNNWTVRAVTAHFAALVRPFTDADLAATHDYCESLWDDPHYECECPQVGVPQYTAVDWRNGVRGPCNLIGQAWGDGSYSEAECAAMLAEFEAGRLEVSHRNRVRIDVVDGQVR